MNDTRLKIAKQFGFSVIEVPIDKPVDFKTVDEYYMHDETGVKFNVTVLDDILMSIKTLDGAFHELECLARNY